MHPSRMRTASSLPYGGVSLTGTPWTETPLDRDSPWTETPLDREPPLWTETPLWTEIPWTEMPPGQRSSPGQRLP